MKTKTFAILAVLATVIILNNRAQTQDRYIPDAQEKGKKEVASNPVITEHEISSADSHVKIIGWDSNVPAKRIINAIQEGVTNQITILKLFSGPNIIARSPQDKETWVYYYLWSYKDDKDPNTTIIQMDHPGIRVKHNKTPVSLVITFNDKDIVESYSLRLLKVNKERF
jgi:hypothetical protein